MWMYFCLIQKDLAPSALLAFNLVSCSSCAVIPTEWFTVLSLSYILPNPSKLACFQPPRNIISQQASPSPSSAKHHLRKHYIFQLLALSSTKMKNFQEWSATCIHNNGLEFYLLDVMWTKDFRDLFLSQSNIGLKLTLSVLDCQGFSGCMCEHVCLSGHLAVALRARYFVAVAQY